MPFRRIQHVFFSVMAAVNQSLFQAIGSTGLAAEIRSRRVKKNPNN
ncbi:hypothetical protein SynBIOSE41_02505 [Synechococcus sp. BIOS-E4-1]|nr:hypothetical protein SynBIOSE41_02505 [Synechococcus sp. BIOS-E4-1]